MTYNKTSYRETWPAQHKACLIRLVKAHSFSKVAELFNAEFGTSYSRNAIIGKAHRLGLCRPARRNYVKKEQPRKTVRHVTMKPKKLKPLLREDGDHGRRKPNFLAFKPGSLPVMPETFPETARPFLESSVEICRWPTSGEGDTMNVCGALATIGSYCDEHAQRAYTVMPTRKRNIVARTAALLEYKDHG